MAALTSKHHDCVRLASQLMTSLDKFLEDVALD